MRHFRRVAARFQRGGQEHHVHRDTALAPQQGVFSDDDHLALFFGAVRRVGDLGHPPANEMRAFLQNAVIELLVAFVDGAHVDIEVVDFAPVFSITRWANLSDDMQQIAEQCELYSLSRLPTQWMIATDFGSVTPSRSVTLPSVGPAALVSRSNSRLVKTLGSRP
jgi:hypothetical protein